jgi:hypothetical protein
MLSLKKSILQTVLYTIVQFDVGQKKKASTSLSVMHKANDTDDISNLQKMNFKW